MMRTNSLFTTTLGEVVKAWREKRGWSLTELSTRSGYSKGYISGLEKNKTHQPNEEHQVGLAKALGIPVELLLLRQLPDELSTDEQKGIEEEGGFVFGSPLPSPQQKHLEEEEQLRQILAQLDELRNMVKKLIAQKGRQR